MRGSALQGKLAAALHELRLLALGHIHLACLHEGCVYEAAGGHRIDGQGHLHIWQGLPLHGSALAASKAERVACLGSVSSEVNNALYVADFLF